MPTRVHHAITLRLVDYSETSQIAVLFSRQAGKFSAIAKGSRRQYPSALARFSGGLELLSRGEAVVIERPGRELANLIEWNLLQGYWHLRRDLEAFRLAMYAADVTAHLLADHQPHPRSFDALDRLLEGLADPAGRTRALLEFQWTLCDDLGYRPVLDHDIATGQALPADTPTLAFDPAGGGLTADRGAPGCWRVHRRTARLLAGLAANGEPGRAGPDDMQRANRLLCAYLRYLLDKHLPTMDVLLEPRPL